MAYKTNSAPYLRTKKSTFQIMVELGIALAVVWVAAVVTTFLKLGSDYGIKSILLMVVALAVTAGCDVVTTFLRNKKDKTLLKKIGYDVVHNYSWITAMIFTLLCPVWTNYYVVIVGSIFSTVIVKNVFGGFGRNIFNPAAFGRIFIQVCFDLSAPKDLAKAEGLLSGSTVTGAYNSAQQWLGSFGIDGISNLDILFGNYFGTMGETFTLLLLVIGIVLAVRGVINWRAPVFYVGTVAITSLIIGFVLGFEQPFTYVLYHLGLGGLMFGAVFMITDPVTTPTSPLGNCIVGIIAAFITMFIRVGTKGVEGVVYSLAIINLISPSLDLFITGKTGENTGVKSGVTFGLSAATIALITCAAWVNNGGREINTINGISRPEYTELEKNTSTFTCMQEGYSFAIYSKGNAPVGTASFGKCQGAYSIVNSNLEEVAVVYCIEDNITIEMAGHQSERKSIVYVAISTTTNQVIGLSVASGGYTGAPYSGFIADGLANYDFSNNILNEQANTIFTGATWSGKGLLEIAQKALDIYTNAYGV